MLVVSGNNNNRSLKLVPAATNAFLQGQVCNMTVLRQLDGSAYSSHLALPPHLSFLIHQTRVELSRAVVQSQCVDVINWAPKLLHAYVMFCSFA